MWEDFLSLKKEILYQYRNTGTAAVGTGNFKKSREVGCISLVWCIKRKED